MAQIVVDEQEEEAQRERDREILACLTLLVV